MPKRLSSFPGKRVRPNQRRTRPTFAETLSQASRRAREKANRPLGRRAGKSVYAAIAAMEDEEEFESMVWMRRLLRWAVALVLLPLCFITSWTFLIRFSHAAVEQGFWQTEEFWYFMAGILLMIGWFASGLLKSFFLYLYVLGHELTHVVFVLLHLGKVTDFHVSVEGGYITTTKTNLIIALSPYFVPFWSVVAVAIYLPLRIMLGFSHEWDRLLYALLGLTWAFHMAWTVWMIQRDQPDLKENGTLLSLVIIYLANLLVVVGLLCVAAPSPLRSLADFGADWLRYAVTAGDAIYRMMNGTILRWAEEAALR